MSDSRYPLERLTPEKIVQDKAEGADQNLVITVRDTCSQKHEQNFLHTSDIY